MLETILRNSLSLQAEADTQALEGILQSIITEEYLSEQVKLIVNDGFDYMQGAADAFDLTVDLRPIKDALTEEKQNELLTALAAALPVCETDEVPSFGIENRRACKPQGISDEYLIEYYLAPAMPQILAQMPDDLPLSEQWQSLEDRLPWTRFLPGMALPAGLLLAVLAVSFIAVLVWYLAAMIADSGWRGRLQWLGWMLMIPSLLIFLLGVLLWADAPVYWLNYGLSRIDLRGLPAELATAETIRTLTQPMLLYINSAFLTVGGICGGLALGLIVWGLITPRERRPEKPPKENAV